MLYQLQHSGFSEYFCKEYGKDFSFPVHMHHSFEFVTVFSGEMKITVDNTEYTLTKGEALLIFPHQLHSLNSNESTHMLCIFSPEIIKAYSSKTSGKLPQNSKFIPSSHLIDSVNTLLDSSSLISKKAVLYTLSAEFDNNTKYVEKNDEAISLLYKIFDFIDKNYQHDCSLFNLSKEVYFSYNYLSKYFKESVGTSFNNYVNQYKITKACYFLHNSTNSILQCALDSGYESLRSFNRNFKAIVGITPKEYRKNIYDNRI